MPERIGMGFISLDPGPESMIDRSEIPAAAEEESEAGYEEDLAKLSIKVLTSQKLPNNSSLSIIVCHKIAHPMTN